MNYISPFSFWPFPKKAPTLAEAVDDPCFMARYWSSMNPPITVEEHLSAKARLNRPLLPSDLLHPDGSMTMFWYEGGIDARDYTRRDGYVVRPDGFDRFGWPSGDPQSPAALL